MLNDKDQLHSDKIPNSLPMAYIMKWKSLPTNDLRFLGDECWKDLDNLKIPILCEIYDGQWCNIVHYDKSGQPLNRLQLAKQTWDRIGKPSKDKIIEDLTNSTKLFEGDRDLMPITNLFKMGIKMLYNIKISKSVSGPLLIRCLRGIMYPRSIMPYICTLENDEMWQHPELFAKETISWAKKWSKSIGLQPNESNIVDLLDGNVTQPTIQNSSQFDEDFLPDLDVQLTTTLTEVEFVLVQDIISELQNNNEEKWGHLTPEICYTELLKMASTWWILAPWKIYSA